MSAAVVLVTLDRAVIAVLPQWPPLPPDEQAAATRDCAVFVRAQMKRAPIFVRGGFWALFAAYAVFVLLRAGPQAADADLARLLATFSNLPLPMVAGLERVLRSAVAVAFFDRPAVAAALGEPSASERQAAFRARRAALRGGP